MEPSTVQSLRVSYGQQSVKQQIYALCLLSSYLTLEGRSLYPPSISIEQAYKVLKTINEIQHSIVNQLIPLLTDNPRRYPDDVFINIIIEKSDYLHDAVVRGLSEALHRSNEHR
jgi:hypothetical protein